MNLNLTVFEGLELGREKRISKALEAIEERNQAKKELEKRSRDLRTQADRIRHKDPVKARMLDHRGIVLADEVHRITKENKRAMTSGQLRRSAAKARLALAKDDCRK